MSKDHSRDVHFLRLVLNNWNSFSVVPNFYPVVLTEIQIIITALLSEFQDTVTMKLVLRMCDRPDKATVDSASA